MKLENPQAANFVFRVEGNAFEQGIPVPLMCALLEDVQSIFDKSYLAIIGKERMIAAERMRFHLMANEIRKGSLETLFGIAITGGSLFPLHDIFKIWEVTYGAFHYLREVFSAAHQNQHYTSTIEQGGDVYAHAPTIVNTTNIIFNVAEKSCPDVRKMVKKIDGEKINNFNIVNTHMNQNIYMGSEERDIFNLPSRIEEEKIDITCEIYDYNKYKNEGWLHVDEDCKAIPTGNYKFQVASTPSTKKHVQYVLAMLENRVTLRCVKVVEEKNPLGEKHRIVKILVERIVDEYPKSSRIL